ncbi:hypothetical protein AAHC03_016497 [Spirometra sp. Aus1]
MVIQTISLLDQMDKDINTFSMRIKEWFSYHFPELMKIVPESSNYIKLVNLLRSREQTTEDRLQEIEDIVQDHEKAQAIVEAAKTSMGFDVTDQDVENLTLFTNRIKLFMERRAKAYDYLVSKLSGVAPNLNCLIGSQVAARLISHAGSLTNLAKFPASTIQILGAEKALFRALRTRGRTPKYGLIFHSSFIGRAAKENKGRISRFLAAKCALATRIDCFSDILCNVYGKHLRQQVEDRLKYFESGEMPKTNAEAMAAAIIEANKVIRKLKKRAIATLNGSSSPNLSFYKKDDEADVPSLSESAAAEDAPTSAKKLRFESSAAAEDDTGSDGLCPWFNPLMWIIYSVLLLSFTKVHGSWDYYGNIDTHFEPYFYISKMQMGNGVEIQIQTKDFYRVHGVDVETTARKEVHAEVNGNLIRIPNPPEYVCLTFRLEGGSVARRCIFVERLYSRIDMSFNVHVERLNNPLQSYKIQWRASEEENFGVLVYNTTHMKQFIQKTSSTALYNLRPGTTYVICVSSNVGRLQIACTHWRTNNSGLDTESTDSAKALQIPVALSGLGDTWSHLVWEPPKIYKRGWILAPEAYLLLAQPTGSPCPDRTILIFTSPADEGTKTIMAAVQAIKDVYFEHCVDISMTESRQPCSCSSDDRPVWIDGIPYKNVARKNYSFEFTIRGLEINRLYNFTVIPVLPFFHPSRWLYTHVSVFGQTGTKASVSPVPGIVISVICLFGLLGIIAYLVVDHYLRKGMENEHKPDAAPRGSFTYATDRVSPRPPAGTLTYEDGYMLPHTTSPPAFRSSVKGRDATATLPGLPESLPSKRTPQIRPKKPDNLSFLKNILKRDSVYNPEYVEPRQDNLENNYEELHPDAE